MVFRAGRHLHLSAEPQKPVSVYLPPERVDSVLQWADFAHFLEQEGIQPLRTASAGSALRTGGRTDAWASQPFQKLSIGTRQVGTLWFNWVWLVLIIKYHFYIHFLILSYYINNYYKLVI